MNIQASAPTKLVAIPDRRTKKAIEVDGAKPTQRQAREATAKRLAAEAVAKTDHSASNKAIAAMLAREAATNKEAPPIPTTGYTGPMRALRDRTKAGLYVKGANGQPSCGDEVATILGQLKPVEVIKACLIAMNIVNPYTHLNIGQQSMNLRNKLRGALKRGDFGPGVLREAVEEVIEARPAPAPEASTTAAAPEAPAKPAAKRASKAKK